MVSNNPFVASGSQWRPWFWHSRHPSVAHACRDWILQADSNSESVENDTDTDSDIISHESNGDAMFLPTETKWKTHEDFDAELAHVINKLLQKGHMTFKSGSCFLDCFDQRTTNQSQYPRTDFVNEDAIAVNVLFDTDTHGGRCETKANSNVLMVNVRKNEDNGFARKPGDPP